MQGMIASKVLNDVCRYGYVEGLYCKLYQCPRHGPESGFRAKPGPIACSSFTGKIYMGHSCICALSTSIVHVPISQSIIISLPGRTLDKPQPRWGLMATGFGASCPFTRAARLALTSVADRQ